MHRHRLLALLGCAAASIGCSGPEASPRGTVRGRITSNGKPVSGAVVVFVNKTVGVSQSATVDDDGKYEFASYNAAGLPVASYQVTVNAGRFLQPGEEIPRVTPALKGGAPAAKKPGTAFPEKYAKPESSGLAADVKAGENAPFDFDLKP